VPDCGHVCVMLIEFRRPGMHPWASILGGLEVTSPRFWISGSWSSKCRHPLHPANAPIRSPTHLSGTSSPLTCCIIQLAMELEKYDNVLYMCRGFILNCFFLIAFIYSVYCTCFQQSYNLFWLINFYIFT
jgi:hypothetical protein